MESPRRALHPPARTRASVVRARGDRRMADESKGVLGHLPPLPRKALNNSVIGMEQAYRQRKGLPLLSDADIEALKAGEPMPWERGDGAGATAGPATPPAPACAPTAAAAPPPPA